MAPNLTRITTTSPAVSHTDAASLFAPNQVKWELQNSPPLLSQVKVLTTRLVGILGGTYCASVCLCLFMRVADLVLTELLHENPEWS